jgi:hypothetical protein
MATRIRLVLKLYRVGGLRDKEMCLAHASNHSVMNMIDPSSVFGKVTVRDMHGIILIGPSCRSVGRKWGRFGCRMEKSWDWLPPWCSKLVLAGSPARLAITG